MPITLTTQAVETLAQWRVIQCARKELAEAQVTNVVMSGVWDGDVYRLTATFTCVEDIARTVPLLTDMT